MVRLLNDLLSFIIPLLSVIGPVALLLFFGTVNIIDDMQRTFDNINRDSK